LATQNESPLGTSFRPAERRTRFNRTSPVVRISRSRASCCRRPTPPSSGRFPTVQMNPAWSFDIRESEGLLEVTNPQRRVVVIGDPADFGIGESADEALISTFPEQLELQVEGASCRPFRRSASPAISMRRAVSQVPGAGDADAGAGGTSSISILATHSDP